MPLTDRLSYVFSRLGYLTLVNRTQRTPHICAFDLCVSILFKKVLISKYSRNKSLYLNQRGVFDSGEGDSVKWYASFETAPVSYNLYSDEP